MISIMLFQYKNGTKSLPILININYNITDKAMGIEVNQSKFLGPMEAQLKLSSLIAVKKTSFQLFFLVYPSLPSSYNHLPVSLSTFCPEVNMAFIAFWLGAQYKG